MIGCVSVRTCKDKMIVNLLHLFAFLGCQVDRVKLSIVFATYPFVYVLCSLFIFFVPLKTICSQTKLVRVRRATGLILEAPLGSERTYTSEVAALLEAYESSNETALVPGERGKVGIKVNTRGGRGLSTPLQLLNAVIDALVARGFERSSILIVDHSLHGLREAGILSTMMPEFFYFEGCPVYSLDRELYYNEDWFYDSPLPPSRNHYLQLLSDTDREGSYLLEGVESRKSFLPMPLLFEVDFWVNLAVGVDDPMFGIDGVLASATLWNVSNSERFLRSEATASSAVAEIAAIPELSERMLLHIVSLDRYQYIGGPQFNSLYTESEPLLWMSSDPVAIDRLLFDRMNVLRRNNGFPEIDPLPRQLPFAASLGLGRFEASQIRVRQVEVEAQN